MKIKKTVLIIILVLITLVSTIKIVYADSVSVNMRSTTISYTQGQTATISISLSNIDSSIGISKLSGTLGYDTSVFEPIIDDTSFTALNGWEKVDYNSTTNKFSINSVTPVKSSQTVMKITLKIKDSAKLGDTFIMLNDMKASSGDNDVSTSPATLSISIKENTSSNVPTIQTTPIPDITTINPSVNVVTSPSASPAVNQSPTAKTTPIASVVPSPTSGNLPQTGINNISEIMLVIGATMISIGTFIMYRKNCK